MREKQTSTIGSNFEGLGGRLPCALWLDPLSSSEKLADSGLAVLAPSVALVKSLSDRLFSSVFLVDLGESDGSPPERSLFTRRKNAWTDDIRESNLEPVRKGDGTIGTENTNT